MNKIGNLWYKRYNTSGRPVIQNNEWGKKMPFKLTWRVKKTNKKTAWPVISYILDNLNYDLVCNYV